MINVYDFSTMIGQEVRINRGGPESKNVLLLNVKSDHLVCYEDKEGVIYFNIQHIKSISLITKAQEAIVQSGLDTDTLVTETPESLFQEASGSTELPVIPENLEYIDAYNFLNVMQSMKNSRVQINRGGPEKLEGILGDAFYDHIVLELENEKVKVFNFHIKSISYVPEVVQETENQTTTKKSNSKGKKVSFKIKRNKRGSSKSSSSSNKTSSNKTSSNKTSRNKTSSNKKGSSKNKK